MATLADIVFGCVHPTSLARFWAGPCSTTTSSRPTTTLSWLEWPPTGSPIPRTTQLSSSNHRKDGTADVRFGLVIDDLEQFDTLRDGLQHDELVAFLTPSELWNYENDLYGIMVDGALLCRVEGEDLNCPALEDGLASALELDQAADILLPSAASEPPDREPTLPFENPELAGLCEDLINDFGEGEPSPATTEEEAAAAELLVAENSILRGLEVRDGKIFHPASRSAATKSLNGPARPSPWNRPNGASPPSGSGPSGIGTTGVRRNPWVSLDDSTERDR